MRKPSAATELRTTKRLLNDLREECKKLVRERDQWRGLYTKVSLDVAEWKRRFDALLKVMPPQEPQ